MYADLTLREFVDVWLKTFKADTIRLSSYERLECTLKTLRKYDICDMQIAEITAFDIQRYVNEVAQDGYGLSTVKKMLRIVTAPLKQAAAMHFIPSDPSAGVKLPTADKIKKPKRETRAYTEEEQAAIWEVIEASTDPGATLIGLMLETGLRCGEALALRWRFVDLPRKRLRVEATILNVSLRGRSILQETPKTMSSRRTVPLTPRAIHLLNGLSHNSEWLFTMDNGERMSYDSLLYRTKRLCSDANVEYLGEHVFRRTFATNCYYKNVDVKILSKILGHADVNITYNIYINLRGDGFEEMYNALNSPVYR